MAEYMLEIPTSGLDAGLTTILEQRLLRSVFQPIVNLSDATVYGYEGLIRGPAGKLHAPLALFDVAKRAGLLSELEYISRQTVLETYAAKSCLYKLFINLSPECLMSPKCIAELKQDYIYSLGLNPHNIVIELTESSPTIDFRQLCKATDAFREMGFEIAIDDLGEGFSSLRLWSELQPDYVKIDKHFIRDINTDALKLEFVKSIRQIAENSDARIIAEGIETAEELDVIRGLSIPYAQGYLLGKPDSELMVQLPDPVKCLVTKSSLGVHPASRMHLRNKDNLIKLVRYAPAVNRDAVNNNVYEMFERNPNLYAIAVVDEDIPVGLISRYTMIDSFAKPYSRELFGKKTCEMFMLKDALIVEKSMSLHTLSDLITNMEPRHLSNGFIVTDGGKYLGLGNGHDLLREITQMQIKAARYANPLTLLPGNVPINEHVDRLLEQGAQFWACYCDLDNFKPFNDAYGFNRGDDLIKYVGSLLSGTVSVDIDFVGHIGGDDFVVIFQSSDWEARCNKMLKEFASIIPSFYDEQDVLKGGIEAKDRTGNKLFYPFSSLSIGVVKVDADFASHHEVIGAISRAKRQAKQIAGNSIFLERRTAKG